MKTAVSVLVLGFLWNTTAHAAAECSIAEPGFAALARNGRTPEYWADKQARLRTKVANWQRWQSRTMSASEWRSDEVSRRVRRSLIVDNSSKLAKSERDLFNKAQLAFLKGQDALERVDGLDRLAAALRAKPGKFSAESLRHELTALRIPGAESAAFKNADDAMLWINQQAHTFSDIAEENVIVIGKSIDDYRPAYATLVKAIENDSRGELGKRASDALQNLSPQKLIVPEYGNSLPNGLPNKAIHYHDMQALLDRYPAGEIARLRQELHREVFDFVLSISPAERIWAYLDRLGKKMLPGAQKELAALFKSVDQARVARIYYPDIGRITSSQADVASKLKLLEVMNVNRGNGNELLVTMARRVDLQDEWKELLRAARGPIKEAMDDAFAKMEAMHPEIRYLTADSGTNVSRIIYRAVDFGAVAGSSTYVYRKYFGGDEDSGTLEGSLEELKKELENDPDGKRILEAARDRLRKKRTPGSGDHT